MKLQYQITRAGHYSLIIKEEVEAIEKIADEHAIAFARYIANHPKIFNNGSSMEQALSLFKIEHNL